MVENKKNDSLETLAAEILQSSPFRGRRILRLEPIAGDVSGRRYFRLQIEGPSPSTAVLMLLNQAAGPVGGGVKNYTQDDTFVELQSFFSAAGVKVPKLFVDARKIHALLIEDVGSVSLWKVARNEMTSEIERVCAKIPGDYVTELYKRAISVIKCLQELKPDQACVAFQRQVSFEQYRREASEFIEYYAVPKGVRRAAKEVLEKFRDNLCETLCAHPKKLSHFDFTSHNLFIDPDGQIRILDFQDACLVSPARDIVSLINDRDIDTALGKSRHAELLHYFKEHLSLGQSFDALYNQYILHWDLRVSGRFMCLANHKGKPVYMQWVPGTLRRLGRTLLRMQGTLHGIEDVLQILCDLSPEISEGMQDPWLLG